MNLIERLIMRVEELERRLNNVVREGRVTDVDAAKGLIRLALAEGESGETVKSPWVRPSENAGSLQTWALPSEGQWMKLFSPGGEIGKNSMALSHSWANDKGQPSSDGSEPMLKSGSSEIRLKDGQVTINATKIVLNGAVETNGTLKNNDKDVGSTHRHGDVVPGGGQTGVPT